MAAVARAPENAWLARSSRPPRRAPPGDTKLPLDQRRGHPWLTIGPAAADALRRTTGIDVSWWDPVMSTNREIRSGDHLQREDREEPCDVSTLGVGLFEASQAGGAVGFLWPVALC